MNECIFLSASVPDPKRNSEYAESSNSVAIASAVRALVHVTLGRRVLIWGGHPAITSMIKVVAEEMEIDYGKWVKLYQSLYFEEQFPDDNDAFHNIVYTEGVNNELEKSLILMRRRMFAENVFSAAVFIGGMGGVIDEFNQFQEDQPSGEIIPVVSTGGASIDVAKKLLSKSSDLVDSDLYYELDYVRLFHKKLGISVKEERYLTPDLQPNEIQDRYWKKKTSVVNKSKFKR